MVAVPRERCNFGAKGVAGDTAQNVDPSPSLLALRLAGQDHALEPGRDYLLGSARDCDFRIPAGVPHLARVSVTANGATLHDLGAPGGLTHNGVKVTSAALVPADVFSCGEVLHAIVVRDFGSAAIVPLPALRAAAGERRVRAAAHALLRSPESEAERLQSRLRSAPWFTLSLALHVLTVLAFLWLPRTERISGLAPATVGVDFRSEQDLPAAGPDAPPAIEPEPEPTIEPEPVVMTEPAPKLTVEPDPTPTPTLPSDPQLPGENALLSTTSPPVTAGGGDSQPTDLVRLGSGGFQKTVAELRQSGLEIVFVFDSTGSMSHTIHDTKTTILQMLAVLQSLVPDARIGLVTYRDKGPRERFVVRQIPLGLDPWRASNFVQFVTAEGGGDRPEDVRAGLQAAFAQPWRSGARRVVVLAGDAPPHESDQQRLLSEVRSFVANGRSSVHTLVTSPDTAGEDTHAAFKKIATAGKGTSQGLQNSARVLQSVLTVAFGHEFDEDIATVTRVAEAEQGSFDVRALDLAHRGGVDLAKELQRVPVPQAVCNALVRRPRRAVVEQLVQMLTQKNCSATTRQALAGVLQRILKLPTPPVDPVTDALPGARELDELRRLASRLPD